MTATEPDVDTRETAETEPMEQISMHELVQQPPPEPRRQRRTKDPMRPLAKPR